MTDSAPNITRLILGSASPRRAELLRSVGCEFNIVAVSVDERVKLQETPEDYLRRVTSLKSDAAWQHQADYSDDGSAAVLCADTIVVHDNQILGKPTDFEDAVRTWTKLSASEHYVHTALRLRWDENQNDYCVVTTVVEFDELEFSQMEAYWHTEEPLDKAGSYAIQGLASAWVKAIHGSYSNVVGLPLRETNHMLAKIGLNWL